MTLFLIGFSCGYAAAWLVSMAVLFSCRKSPDPVEEEPEVEPSKAVQRKRGLTMWD